MNTFKKYSVFLCLTLVMLALSSTTVVSQGVADCDCTDLYLIGTQDWQDCEEFGCSGADVPVNGNIWLLAMAGFVFAFVKFGGHTKLAGYYYSRIEKQE